MSRIDEVKKLIETYQRRLQKLEEQKALYGISADPRISLEIEDIQKKLVELRAQLDLRQIRTKHGLIIEPRIHSELRDFLLVLKNDGVPAKKLIETTQEITSVVQEKFYIDVLMVLTKEEIAGINEIAKDEEEASIIVHKIYKRRTGRDPGDVCDDIMSTVVKVYKEDYLKKKKKRHFWR
jgi:hypothetical protein